MEVLLAAGCNGCLDKIIRMIAEDGESVLVEESMFSGVRLSLRQTRLNAIQ